MDKLDFPQSFSIANLCEFSISCRDYPACRQLVFDAGFNRRITPTALITLVKIARERERSHLEEQVVYSRLREHEYANNLGFSNAFGITAEGQDQRAHGGKNYVPISKMRQQAITKQASNKSIAFEDAIQENCDELASIVAQDVSSGLKEILANAFREVFRNVFDHSEHDTAVYCIQYWPKYQKVEVCITDAGIGIPRSFEKNPYLNPENSTDALYASLMPGVSSIAWKAKKKRAAHKSDWDNAGYGLYFLRMLFGKLGHFFVGSGGVGLLFEAGDSAKEIECHWRGTVISMSISVANEGEIEKRIGEIQKEASAIKQRFGARRVDFSSVRAFLFEND